ncbi:MAG: lytic transglycosylase domain-containing protein [Candidatus Tectomicrobia bacterium]|uniref:Lytic transglycosylase domain-containing protein n=1 Tax=Tectimicrobiota bacterium TaxID=2528274 RepID=A0A932GMW2_UNCTE|nr:lytic transglycosylase domain-containing protein [Candidatus Tectomicrobia bacterium]
MKTSKWVQNLLNWVKKCNLGLLGSVIALLVLSIFYFPAATGMYPERGIPLDELLNRGEARISSRVLQKELGMDAELADQVAGSVVRYARASNIPWELVVAVIKVESAGYPQAVSPRGAKGLMQVMPFWTTELGADPRAIFEPETNVWMGISILKHYLQRYKALDVALAAYNGSLGSPEYPEKVLKTYRQLISYQLN